MIRSIYLRTAAAAPRAERLNGIDYLVVPVVALMEGVIHAVNADFPEFVPADVLAEAAASWNGRPLVLGHPRSEGGDYISALNPKVLEAQGVGLIFQSQMAGDRKTKLGMEAWFDPARLVALGKHELLKRVRNGDPIEVSVGAGVRMAMQGGQHGGKTYKARWAKVNGDHLAIIEHGRGACSVEMGCGVHRAAEQYDFTGDDVTVLESKEPRMKSLRERLKDMVAAFRTAAAPEDAKLVERFLESMKDCPDCKGSGKTDGKECATCEGMGEVPIKAAEAIHDTGRAAQEAEMKDKQELIRSLTECPCSGFTKDDIKALEAMSVERLTALTAHSAKVKADGEALKVAQGKVTELETAVKTSDEKVKALEGAAKTTEDRIKALETAQGASLSEEEFLKRAPASIKALVEKDKAASTARRTALIDKLKACGQKAYTEDELKALDDTQLEKVAALANVNLAAVPDFSGRALAAPHVGAGGDDDKDYEPTSGYDAGIKALQGAK